jgi:hypothetical protein
MRSHLLLTGLLQRAFLGSLKNDLKYWDLHHYAEVVADLKAVGEDTVQLGAACQRLQKSHSSGKGGTTRSSVQSSDGDDCYVSSRPNDRRLGEKIRPLAKHARLYSPAVGIHTKLTGT